MSNALSGVVAANTKYPVFACPPFSDKTDMMVNINSTLQMPSNVPVATILKPGNLAMFINKMYSL
jgi:5-(carboxyamino)imidazole ribonucleotide mutase